MDCCSYSSFSTKTNHCTTLYNLHNLQVCHIWCLFYVWLRVSLNVFSTWHTRLCSDVTCSELIEYIQLKQLAKPTPYTCFFNIRPPFCIHLTIGRYVQTVYTTRIYTKVTPLRYVWCPSHWVGIHVAGH